MHEIPQFFTYNILVKKRRRLLHTIGVRAVIQREQDGAFWFVVPEWIADCFGEPIVVQFDGETLTITSGGEIED